MALYTISHALGTCWTLGIGKEVGMVWSILDRERMTRFGEVGDEERVWLLSVEVIVGFDEADEEGQC